MVENHWSSTLTTITLTTFSPEKLKGKYTWKPFRNSPVEKWWKAVAGPHRFITEKMAENLDKGRWPASRRRFKDILWARYDKHFQQHSWGKMCHHYIRDTSYSKSEKRSLSRLPEQSPADSFVMKNRCSRETRTELPTSKDLRAEYLAAFLAHLQFMTENYA